MEIELQVTVLRTGEIATLTGCGDWFEMRFVASGDRGAVEYLAAVLRDDSHAGYTGFSDAWVGKIGGSAPKLLDVLDQLSHDTPGRAAQIRWRVVQMPDPDPLPGNEGNQAKGVVW